MLSAAYPAPRYFHDTIIGQLRDYYKGISLIHRIPIRLGIGPRALRPGATGRGHVRSTNTKTGTKPQRSAPDARPVPAPSTPFRTRTHRRPILANYAASGVTATGVAMRLL